MKSIKATQSIEKDASIYLRNQLKANYVTLPQVSHRIPIERYFTLAERLYEQAIQYYQKKDSQYINAYIDYQKFLLLTLDRIPKHQQYKLINTNSNGNGRPAEVALIKSKIWLEKVRIEALRSLEEIVKVMDKVEYQRQQSLKLDALEAEFDDIDISSAGKAPEPSGSIQLNHSISPVSPSSDCTTRPASIKEIPNSLSGLQAVSDFAFSYPTLPAEDESPNDSTFLEDEVVQNQIDFSQSVIHQPTEPSAPASVPELDESLSQKFELVPTQRTEDRPDKWDILKNPYDLSAGSPYQSYSSTATTSNTIVPTTIIPQAPKTSKEIYTSTAANVPLPTPPPVFKPEPCPLPLEDIFIAKYLLAQSMQP